MDILDRDLALFAIADDAGGLGLQPDELADRLAGAGLGARLEQSAEEDQRQDHADGLVVDLLELLGDGIGRDRDEEAVAERRAGAERDERVHVGAAVAEDEPAGAVDRPSRVEHDGRDEGELHPRIQEELRDPGRVEELRGHDREEHRRGQEGSDDDATGEVTDLGAPSDRLRVLARRRAGFAAFLDAVPGGLDRDAHLIDPYLRGIEVDGYALRAGVGLDAVDAGQPVDQRLDVRDARGACQTIGPKRELHPIGAAHLPGRSHTHGSCHFVAVGRHRSKPGTGERGVRHGFLLLAVAVACLYEEGAVEHVHPTCEPELPRSRRRELDRRSTERGERLAHSEVGEDNPRGTITVLLTIENEPERNTFLDTDQVRGVPALDVDLDLLDPSAHLRSSRPFRAEEEPRKRRDQRHPARRHEDLRPSHVGLTSLTPLPLWPMLLDPRDASAT